MSIKTIKNSDSVMKNRDDFQQLLQKIEVMHGDIKITALRKDILKIIVESAYPLAAYAILDLLRKERSGAEPPTVYRVIEYFLEKKIIHKIDSDNTYIICSHVDDVSKKSHGILLTCLKCNGSSELYDQNFFDALESVAKSKKFKIDCPVIQVKGVCSACSRLV